MLEGELLLSLPFSPFLSVKGGVRLKNSQIVDVLDSLGLRNLPFFRYMHVYLPHQETYQANSVVVQPMTQWAISIAGRGML